MICIEALPVEVVRAIVTHIDVCDLSAVALVSHFFNAVATPGIYAEVRYTYTLANKWGEVVCPLKLLSARSDLLPYLNYLEIRDIPREGVTPYPEFIQACLDVVKRAPSLVAFFWGIYGDNDWYYRRRPPRILLTFWKGQVYLSSLLLNHLGPVEHISLHLASELLNKALVEWATSGATARLTSLGIFGNCYLELPQLHRILDHTPSLKSLSIINCHKIVLPEMLSLIRHLKLESLELEVLNGTNIASLTTILPIIPTLRCISFDVFPPMEETTGQPHVDVNDPLTEQLLLHVLGATKGVTLHSLIFRLPYIRAFTPNLLDVLKTIHSMTLRRLHLFELRVPAQLIASMLQHIPVLEDLGVVFREALNGLDLIIEALPAAHHLRILTDLTLAHETFDMPEPPALKESQAEQLLQAGPALRYVVSLQFSCEWTKSYDWSEEELKMIISSRRVKEP